MIPACVLRIIFFPFDNPTVDRPKDPLRVRNSDAQGNIFGDCRGTRTGLIRPNMNN